MTQRKIRDVPADELYAEWQRDIDTIYDEIIEMFWFRRVFRDIQEVFVGNPYLQNIGGYIWEWMLLNYAAAVLIRIRRQLDTQGNHGESESVVVGDG